MQNGYRAMEYRQQEVMGASPIRLVVMAYDLAIRACEQEDFVRATSAVSTLRDALNYEYAEVAVGLFSLYQWCLDRIRKEDYASALVTLRELRQAWITVEKRLAPVPGQVVQAGIPMAASAA
jgi:flagellin-specific chaperone FliS